MKDISRGTFFINDIECYLEIEKVMQYGIKFGELLEIGREYYLVTLTCNNEENELRESKDSIIKDLNRILSLIAIDSDRVIEKLNNMLMKNNRKIYVNNVEELVL